MIHILEFYEYYVTLLRCLITGAVLLSVVVASDRLYHVLKYVQLVIKSKLTGKRAEDGYQLQPFPDPEFFSHLWPKVGAGRGLCPFKRIGFGPFVVAHPPG